MNQVLEQYLRCYINYEENDWAEKLPAAQLAYSTAYNESTRLTSIANFGFTPSAFHPPRDPKTINPAAILKSDDLKNLHEEMKTEVEFVRNRMNNYYNPKRLKGPTFSEGDMFYLATKNVNTDRPSKKLDYKFIEPYKAIRKISENNYELNLLSTVKYHPIFHVSLLESAADTIHPKTGNESREITGSEVYEAEAIREMRKQNGKTEDLIKWKNYPESESTREMSRARITTIVDNFTVAMNSKSQAASYCLDDRQTEHEYKRPTLVAPLNRKSSAHLIPKAHQYLRHVALAGGVP
jgi:hypothetical protein